MAPATHLSLKERFLISAKERISRSLDQIGRTDAAWDLAGELHRIGGEGSMVNLPEVARLAWEGEKVARLLGGKEDKTARVTCARLLRKLGYLMQELTAKSSTPALGVAPCQPGDGCRVLIVDDSVVAAHALADVFEVRGFEVRSATSLDLALSLCTSFSPAVLVADVLMPDVDVTELCRRFRELMRGQRTAILLISGHSESELRDRLDAIRPEAFVSKMAGADGVVGRVASLFQELKK